MAAKTNALKVTTPSDTEILLVREFDAPRDLVWKAISTPDLIKQWWGLRDSTLIIRRFDFYPGGGWSYVSRGPDGAEDPFKGEYREIVEPERVVQTFIYDVPPFNDMVAVENMTLTERDGKTTLQTLVQHGSKEARDGHLQSGMEGGAGQTMDRLEELLAKLA